MNTQKLTNKAIKLFEDGKFDEVIELVDAVSINDISPNLINVKALSYKNKNDFTSAINIYKEALNSEEHPVYFGNLGNIYKATGRVNDAIALYRDAIARNPNEYNFHDLRIHLSTPRTSPNPPIGQPFSLTNIYFYVSCDLKNCSRAVTPSKTCICIVNE